MRRPPIEAEIRRRDTLSFVQQRGTLDHLFFATLQTQGSFHFVPYLPAIERGRETGRHVNWTFYRLNNDSLGQICKAIASPTSRLSTLKISEYTVRSLHRFGCKYLGKAIAHQRRTEQMQHINARKQEKGGKMTSTKDKDKIFGIEIVFSRTEQNAHILSRPRRKQNKARFQLFETSFDEPSACFCPSLGRSTQETPIGLVVSSLRPLLTSLALVFALPLGRRSRKALKHPF